VLGALAEGVREGARECGVLDSVRQAQRLGQRQPDRAPDRLRVGTGQSRAREPWAKHSITPGDASASVKSKSKSTARTSEG
jgi:hypothetical protein